jgi:RNA polymerase sigma-70 factor (ECF subfamily)
MVANENTTWSQCRKGDKAAFADLYELTSDRLYRYGMKFTNDEELVKDSIHDLFLKLYQNRTDLPEMEHFIFYLFKMLKNILIDNFRHHDKMVYVSPDELPFHVEFTYKPDDESDVGDEIKEQFEKVLSLLSDRQKEAIYLRYQAEMSYEEIAQLLEINYQSARNLIHRAVKKIRDEMDINLFIVLFMSTLK